MSRRLPPSDHCDGTRFYNPVLPGQTGQAGASVPLAILRWRLSGSRAPWPRPIADPPPFGDPRREPDQDSVALTFLGHAGFLIRMGGRSILTDPVFSQRCSPVAWAGPKRARPPGRLLDALPPIDLVLLSHNHYDHLDLPSLRAIVARDDPAFVVPLGTGRTLAKAVSKAGTRRITELDWWETHDVGGLSITATPARHFSARTPFDRHRALWSGFLLSGGPMPVLFAGDSGDGPHWRQIHDRLGAPGLALLPIGAYAPRFLMGAIHMTPEEAVAAHLTLQAERSIGMHFGTFQLTDEQIDEPVRRLAEASRRAGLDPGAFITLGSGDVCTVRRGTRRRAPGSSADAASMRAPTHQESR